jgi:hypothetical protein
MFAYNCPVAENCTVAGIASLGELCEACDAECQTAMTSHVKEGLDPATYVGIVTAVASLITLLWNQYMLTADWEDEELTKDSLLGKLGMAWNGLVMFMGFLCMVLGGVAMGYITSNCPSGYEGQCSSWAIVGFIAIAAFLFLTGLTALLGIWKDEGPMLRIANLCLFLLVILMIVVTTVIGFSSGLVPTVEDLYNEPKMEEEIVNLLSNPQYSICHCDTKLLTDCDDSALTDPSGESQYCSCDPTLVDEVSPLLTAAQCKGVLQVQTLANMQVIGIITLLCVAVSIAVNVLTLTAIIAYRKQDKNSNSEDWEDTPVEAALEEE